jgi:DNA polymerase
MTKLIFIDTETRSEVSVKTVGAHAYAAHPSTRVVVITYALDNGPVRCVAADDLDVGLNRDNLPQELTLALREALAGQVKFVAWNAAFDRLILANLDKRFSRPELWYDAMVAATRMHYPADLASAAEAVGGAKKRRSGKRLMKLFSDTAAHVDFDEPAVQEAWEEFLRYATDDVEALRSVWHACGHLDPAQWPQYWENERINDVGLPIDLAAVHAAAGVAEVLHAEANRAIAQLTGGRVPSATAVAQLARVLSELLAGDEEALALLAPPPEDEHDADTDDADTEHAAISLRRDNLEALLTLLDAREARRPLTEAEDTVRAIARARLDGSGAAARKFRSIRARACYYNGIERWRLYGEYTFNGAPATGRFSSRGVQVHNLPRQPAGSKEDVEKAFEILRNTELSPAEQYARLREIFPDLGRALGRLIRPCVYAPPGRVLVWGDWSAIEARALPWLAGAEEILDVFRAADADPGAPDIYMVQAGRILRKDPRQVTKEERQIYGKVPVLSLGYGGGVGALAKMARAYGVHIDTELAQDIVARWRNENPWALQFWRDLEHTFRHALGTLYTPFQVGRLQIVGVETGDDRTVLIVLPCGRWLAYPQAGLRTRTRVTAQGLRITEMTLSYARGRDVGWLWGGLLAENVTQGICASLLRATLVAAREPLAAVGARVIGHVHDEVIVEAPLDRRADAERALHCALTTPPVWADNWPLRADVTSGERYNKA